jgi:hypothetical protein
MALTKTQSLTVTNQPNGIGGATVVEVIDNAIVEIDIPGVTVIKHVKRRSPKRRSAVLGK